MYRSRMKLYLFEAISFYCGTEQTFWSKQFLKLLKKLNKILESWNGTIDRQEQLIKQ